MTMSYDLAQNLDDFIGEEYNTTDKQTFVIDSIDKAEWAIRKIAKYEANKSEAKELAEKRILQIQAWLKSIEDENDKQIIFFTALLEPYAKQQVTDKKRSIKLPTGILQFKKQQPEFIMDNEKLIAWAEKNAADYVKKEPVLQWGEFKSVAQISKITEETPDGTIEKLVLISPDGEIVPGITITERPDKFYVKAGE